MNHSNALLDTGLFIIHRLASEDRLLSIFSQLGRIPGIDCVHVVTTERTSICQFDESSCGDMLSERLGFQPRPLRNPEKSVFAKHLLALSIATSSKIESIMILEDDVFFHLGKMRKLLLKTLICESPLTYDIVFFGNGVHVPHPQSPVGLFEPDHTIHKSKCADSYLVTQKAAEKILSDIREQKPFMPYDWDLSYRIARLGLRVAWLEPGITWQGSQTGAFQSQIQNIH